MTIEEIFEKFQKNFETVTLTLIAQMNKISENMNRVGETIEIVDKIRIQSIENKQLLTNFDKQMKTILGRLEVMSKGGFELPEAPIGPAAPIQPKLSDLAGEDLDALLNTAYDGPKSAEETETPEPEIQIDVQSPLKSPEPQKQPEIASIPVSDGSLPDSSSKDPEIDLLLNTPSSDDSVSISENAPVPSEPDLAVPLSNPQPKTSSDTLSPLPTMGAKKSPSPAENPRSLPSLTPTPLPTPKLSSPTPAPMPSVPNSPGGKSFPISGWARVNNPTIPKEILTNLMIDVENAPTLDRVGDLIMDAKEMLTKKVPFNKSYFEMLMIAGPNRAKKGAPNTEEMVKIVYEKIKLWIANF
jgi:hypothetical protein